MPFFTINDTIDATGLPGANLRKDNNKPIENPSLNELDFLNS